MLCLSPHLLIASARSLVGTGSLGNLALIEHCGHSSHYDDETQSSSWPIPPGLTIPGLAKFGTSRGVLYDTPDDGDIFLQYGPSRKTFVHACIVASVLASGQFDEKRPYYDVYTIEGDTDSLGRLGGGWTMRVRRRLYPALGDRFLRWVELDGYAEQLASSLGLPAMSRRSA